MPALPPRRRRRIRLPITLSVLLMVVNVILMVSWIVLLAQNNNWSLLTIGTILFILILVGLGIYLHVTIKEIQLNQRQANFVDSVTHELKSPIASLKLYVETLRMRRVADDRRDEFYGFMLKDLDRLDRLINHLLEVGRLDAIVTDAVAEDIELEPLLRDRAAAACGHHHQPPEIFRFDFEPAVVRGGRLALEMVFGNLLDNAVKYGGKPPIIEVATRMWRGKVVVRIADNGPGVPLELRNKIFGLFFRGGKELQRTTHGTGVGLYVVQTLVQKMRGRVSVHDRGREPGAVFEVTLPGRPAAEP